MNQKIKEVIAKVGEIFLTKFSGHKSLSIDNILSGSTISATSIATILVYLGYPPTSQSDFWLIVAGIIVFVAGFFYRQKH